MAHGGAFMQASSNMQASKSTRDVCQNSLNATATKDTRLEYHSETLLLLPTEYILYYQLVHIVPEAYRRYIFVP